MIFNCQSQNKTRLSQYFFILFLGSTLLNPVVQAEDKESKQEVMLGTFIHLQRLYKSSTPVAEKKEAIRKNLADMKSSGLNSVMPYVIGSSGRAYYSSEIVPVQIEEEWDPLEFIMQESKKLELKVYPTVCVLVCGHHHLRGILKDHPEWALRNPEGKKLGFISSANSNARKWVVSVLKEITRKYQPDGLMLDYLRFNNRPMLLDTESQKRFDEKFGDLDEKSRKEAMQKFKEDSLTELARMISDEIRPLKKGIEITIYSWGAHVSSHHQVAQNWKEWIKQKYIDMVCISGYVFEENYGPDFLTSFQKRMEDAEKIRQEWNSSTTLTFCLGIHTSHGEVNQFNEVESYLKIASASGIDGVVLFHWTAFEKFREDVLKHQYFQNFNKEIQDR